MVVVHWRISVFNTLTAIFPMGLTRKASPRCQRTHGVDRFILC